MAVAPSQDPSVPAIMTPARLSGIWCVCARCAAGGMISSLGSGTMELSMAIKSAMSGYPPLLNAFRYQSISGLNMRFVLSVFCEKVSLLFADGHADFFHHLQHIFPCLAFLAHGLVSQ